jgi:hypothetical protein
VTDDRPRAGAYNLTQYSISMDQTATYEVASMEGERVKTRTTVVQKADPQPVVNPQTPSLKMELVRMSGGGRGDATLDFTKPIPVAANGDLRSDMEMTFDAGGKPQTMRMKMKLGVKIDEK